ncbi:MAG: glycosyltransferase [Sediminibacterium sp.]|nr:glycosyltransferase [Sediminibacterium sp.]
MNTPLVTVLMPVYNAEKYIGAAICSILAQSFTEWELLIVNDGSTDRTADVIGTFTDDRILSIDQGNTGVAGALNHGLTRARGKYIARFDADDICMPGRLAKQVAFLESHPGYVLAGSDAEYLLENGEHLFYFSCIAHSHEEITRKLYVYCPFIHSAVMYRKTAVLAAGGYSAHAHNFEDYFLWIQLIKQGKMHNLPERLIKIRFNPASITIDEKWRGQKFRALKREIIHRGSIDAAEGETLMQIIRSQNLAPFKQAAYEALCGKKLLTDNHQPAKARKHFFKAIRLHPLRLDNYALLFASFLPGAWVQWLHEQSPNKL